VTFDAHGSATLAAAACAHACARPRPPDLLVLPFWVRVCLSRIHPFLSSHLLSLGGLACPTYAEAPTPLPSTMQLQAAGKSSQPRPGARGQETRTGIQPRQVKRVQPKARREPRQKSSQRHAEAISPANVTSSQVQSCRADVSTGALLVGSTVVRITDG